MNKMNNKKDDKDKRSVFHVSISESEKLRVKEIADQSNMSISEFIRQAINDKINRIDNPEIDNAISRDDSMILDYLRKHDKKLTEMEKLLRQRMSNGKVIKNSLEEIKARVNHKKLEILKRRIVSTLEEHGSLRPKEIKEFTDIEVHDIYEVISDDSTFGFDNNMRVMLK